MSKLSCRCGYVMVPRTMEEDFLYEIVPQKIIIKILNDWNEKGIKFTSDDFFDYYNKFRRDVYKCPSCGRFIIEDEPGGNKFSSYINEL
ncbi:TPA: hypothetical protein G9F27_004762 [Salmonella enterica]|uniref:Uncharacterized protein n=1 Tax=Salmonella enterica TaxID=28901 RepID=A0A743P3T1_SALER|nr:hypothetical protein [Salmonella enterica]